MTQVGRIPYHADPRPRSEVGVPPLSTVTVFTSPTYVPTCSYSCSCVSLALQGPGIVPISRLCYLLCDHFICRSLSALGRRCQIWPRGPPIMHPRHLMPFTFTPRGRHYLTNYINPSVFEFDIASKRGAICCSSS